MKNITKEKESETMEGQDLHSGREDRHPSRPAMPIITQGMLAEFRRLKLVKRRCEQLRTQILQYLENGALVEDGSLGVDVKVTTQRRLTKAALVELLGEEDVEAMRDVVEPTVYRSLVITDRVPESSRRPPRGQAARDSAYLS